MPVGILDGANALNDKVVMITGGTGSFGTRFVEVVLRQQSPRKVIVFSRDELKQAELQRRIDDTRLRCFIGDVRDGDRLRRAMRGVDVVVHAAALKQVPACEYNPFEAVKTNIIGAANIIEAAIDRGVPKVIALSTDKAVNPVNLYGATKLCAEKLFVQGNAYAGEDGARFSCARYGNVVGSRGSVIPLFVEQRSNGTITVTDDRMTRFWITVDQGVDFVLGCIGAMRGGEIFVPKIPSMRIMDLVAAIAPECEVRITGIRAGEKLHELLISEDEARHTAEFEDCYVIQPVHPWWDRDGIHVCARSLPVGFRLASDTNSLWLSPQDLQGVMPWI